MHTDQYAAQTGTPRQPAPLWMKLMLVTITILATLQLGKDLGGFNFNLVTLVSGSGLGSVMRVLGITTAASPSGKLSAIYDNYNMCQNKLGLDFGVITNGDAFTTEELDKHDQMMKELYALGMRYIQISVMKTGDTDIGNVAEIVRLAYGNHLTPVILLIDTDGSGTGKVDVIVNFYHKVNETAGYGKKFVASTAPRNMIDQGGDWAGLAAVSQTVSDKLQNDEDITIATPLLKVYDPGSGGDDATGHLTSPPDEVVGSRQDEVKIFQKQSVALKKFEIVLVGIKNFDKDYQKSVSQYARRGYFFYDEYGPASTFYKAGRWIRETNDSEKVNVRAIVMDFGPSTNPDTNDAEFLKERLSYDFGSFSDDQTVQAVIFSKSVMDSLVKEKDPDQSPPPTSLLCKVGVNYAVTAGLGGGIINTTKEIGYGYGTIMITSGSDVSNAVADAVGLCEQGIGPVVRSCYTGNCGISSGGEQASIYKQILAGAKGACDAKQIPIYMICGHNEVESEFNNEFAEEGRWSHQCLSSMSGSGAKIISTVFNSTHPELENQVAAWRSGFGSGVAGFDCIGLNTYGIKSGGSIPMHAKDWYNRLFNLDPFKGMPGCVTETGIVDLQGDQGKNPSLSGQEVKGVLEAGATWALGFNYMGNNPSFESFHLTDDGRSVTKKYCNVGDVSKKLSDELDLTALREFFGFANTFSSNCDYDTQPVTQAFSENSKAIACEAQNDGTANEFAKSKIICNSPESCSTTVRYTIQVGLPIRSFASNTVTGTQTHPYQPVSISLSNNVNFPQYDFTNQYASTLTSDSGDYAMPWLGSALYNAGQIAKTQFPAIQSLYDKSLYDSAGAYFINTPREENSAITRNKWVWGYNNKLLDGAVKIPLERALCNGSVCYDKYYGSNDTYARFDYYDPDKLAVKSSAVFMCGGKVQRVDDDPQNMIYGTEVILKTDSWFGTGAQLCYEDWLPDDRVSGGGLNCSIIKTEYCDEYDSQAKRVAACLAKGFTPFCSLASFYLNESNVRSGGCHADAGKVNQTIKYNGGADSYPSTSVKYRSDLPPIPKYDIPGAYDSLANLYRIVQTEMSKRNLKVVFNELPQSGWQSDIILKAYSETPKQDHEITSPRTNQMLEKISDGTVAGLSTARVAGVSTTNGQVLGVNTAGQCETKFMIFGDSVAHLQAASLGLVGNYDAGFPGASTRWFFADQEGAQHGNPNLSSIFNNDAEYVVINLGTNDCGGVDINNFGENLTKIVQAAKSAGKKVVLSNLPQLSYCVGGVTAWNAKIVSVQQQTGAILRDVSGYSSFNDDRHPSSYDEFNTKTFDAIGCSGATLPGVVGTGSGPGLAGPDATGSSVKLSGETFAEYNLYLAENTNFQVAHNYYEALGMIDQLTRVLDLLVNNSGLPGGRIVTSSTGNPYFESGQAEMYAGVLGCDDPLNKKLETEVGHKLNCIVPYAAKGRDAYVSDPLGTFLCTKGYTVDGECDAAQCTPSTPTTPIVTAGRYEGVVCPVHDPANECTQGPFGGPSLTTHCKEGDRPLDLIPSFPSGIDFGAVGKYTGEAAYDFANRTYGARDEQIVAPEAGTVTEIVTDPAVYSYGAYIYIKGKSGVEWQLRHIDRDKIYVAVGQTVTVGQHLADFWHGYGYRDMHTHVSGYYGGNAIDPYLLYGEIAGCRVKRPTADMKSGVTPVERGEYCRYGGKLNDNFCPARAKDQLADSNVIIGLFDAIYEKAGSSTPGIDPVPQPATTQLPPSSVPNTAPGVSMVEVKLPTIIASAEPVPLLTQMVPVIVTGQVASKPKVSFAQATTSGTSSNNNCPGATCPVLPNKNSVPYPAPGGTCALLDDSSLCSSPTKMREMFGGGSCGGACEAQADCVGTSIQKTVITFLGMRFTVNTKIVSSLAEIESDINSIARSHSGADYVFNSGTYHFISSGAFNARPIRGYENTSGADCRISNHSWGTALDINASTNGFQAATCSMDMPPEVVWAFEKHGYRWGGRYGGGAHFDPMHFEFCSGSPGDTPPPGGDIPISCQPPGTPGGGTNNGGGGNGAVTKEDILKLCSPANVSYIPISAAAVQAAYATVSGKTDVSLTRIQQILDEASARNLNPAFLFGFWLTEGGFLGDNRAGRTSQRPNPVGYDFGCGLRASCGIADNLSGPPPAEITNQRFLKSLQCASQSPQASCRLMCSYQAILATQPTVIQGYGTQQPGLGGFLECYGPLADNNANFAKNFIRMYDALFPPGSTNGRVNNGSCNMTLNK